MSARPAPTFTPTAPPMLILALTAAALPSLSTNNIDTGNGAYWKPTESGRGSSKNPDTRSTTGTDGVTTSEADYELQLVTSNTGYVTDKGIEVKGLWFQKVVGTYSITPCSGNTAEVESFTYFEYAPAAIDPITLSGLKDTFGTGRVQTAGSYTFGFVKKVGDARFIPAHYPDDLEAYDILTSFEASDAWNKSDSGRNEVKDANGEPVTFPPGEQPHSGHFPNRPDAPPGWEDNFGGKGQGVSRSLVLRWYDCLDAPYTIETGYEPN